MLKKVPKRGLFEQKIMSHAFTERALLYQLAHTHPFICSFGGFFYDPAQLSVPCRSVGRLFGRLVEPWGVPCAMPKH